MFTGDRIDKICQVIVLAGALFIAGYPSFLLFTGQPSYPKLLWVFAGFGAIFLGMAVWLFREKRYLRMWASARRMVMKEEWSEEETS